MALSASLGSIIRPGSKGVISAYPQGKHPIGVFNFYKGTLFNRFRALF